MSERTDDFKPGAQTETEDLARLYLDLWQKQMTDFQSSPLGRDMTRATEMMEGGYKEMMASFDTPEKAQNWMATWSKAFMEQVAKGMQDNGFSPSNAAHWTAPFGAASSVDADDVGALKERISLLENRVASLEQELSKRSK